MSHMDEKLIPVDVNLQLNSGGTWNADLDYRALFEQTGDCVFIISMDFRILTVNPQASRLLAYSDGDLDGRNLDDVLAMGESARREMLLVRRVNAVSYTHLDVYKRQT